MSVKSNNLETAIFSSFSYFDVDHVFSSEMAKQRCIKLHNELKTSIELLADLEAANENIIWRAPSVGDKTDAAIILKSIKSLIDDKQEEIQHIQDVLLSICKSEAKKIFHPFMKDDDDDSECDTEIEEIDYKKEYEEAIEEIKILKEDSDRADENISMYKKQIIKRDEIINNLKAVIDDLRTQKDENIEQIRQQKEDADKVRIISNGQHLKLQKIIEEKNKEIFYYESKVREWNEPSKLNNN